MAGQYNTFYPGPVLSSEADTKTVSQDKNVSVDEAIFAGRQVLGLQPETWPAKNAEVLT